VALLATTFEPWMLMLSALMFRSPVGSNLKVTGDLNISADNINIQGSKVVANNATIKSDHLNIAAVQDSKKKLSDCSVQREMLVQFEGEKNSCKKNLIFLSREKKNSGSSYVLFKKQFVEAIICWEF
jgi:hypothetical protein